MIKIPVEPPITEYLHVKAAQLGIPINGTFELTPCCNMSCKMCYVRMTPSEQAAIRPLCTAQEWIALGREAKEQGMLYLLLTGGEPFMHPAFREIMEGLHKEGLIISINSNGTLIDEHTVSWLRQSPPARVNITLYGASDSTYERLCGNPRGFTQAIRGIRLLREAGITVRINCSVTPYNASDLEEIFRFVKQEGLMIQATSYMFPPLRRDGELVGQNDRFSPEEAAYYAAKIVSMLNGEERFLEQIEKDGFPAMPNESGEDCPELEGDGIRCRAGKCSFWITWDGKMLPCGMIPSDHGADISSLGFQSAWNEVHSAAALVRLPSQCAQCPAAEQCRACAAMVYTESGNYHTVPRYRCDMTKAFPDACMRLRDELIRKGRE